MLNSEKLKKKFEDKMDKKWLDKLWPFLSSDKMMKVFAYLKSQKTFRIIYPSFDDCFNAFKYTPWDEVRVVIIGQDPYHDGSAHGLAFSAGPNAKRCPPSLKNIILEVEDDCYDGLNLERASSWSLIGWAEQGVLLLNTAFTVEKNRPGSHSKLWDEFTTNVISKLNSEKNGLIYLLWGAHAQSYASLIDENANHIIKTGHPSPLNTSNPFKGCRCFSAVNKIIEGQNGPEFTINWEK